MPKIAQHIERPWLEELMSNYPDGRKGVSRDAEIPRGLLSEYVTGRRTPRPAKAKKIARLVGCDWQLFFP
jgi:hypothetical protein